MTRRLPSLRTAALALRNRAARWIGRSADPFGDTPPGLALSPSARHFAYYETAPLALRFASGRIADAALWQAAARAKLAELAGYGRGANPPAVLHDSELPLGAGGIRRRAYLRARNGVDIPIHIVAPRAPGPSCR